MRIIKVVDKVNGQTRMVDMEMPNKMFDSINEIGFMLAAGTEFVIRRAAVPHGHTYFEVIRRPIVEDKS